MTHSTRLLSRSFALICLANLLAGLSGMMFIQLPRLFKQLGATEANIGLIYSVAALAAVASRPLVGKLLDRQGRRLVLIGTALARCLVVITFVSVDAVDGWAVGLRVIHAVVEGISFATLTTLAADWVPANQRTRGLMLFGISGMSTIAFGAQVSDSIRSHLGFEALFLAAFGLAAASLVASLGIQDHPRLVEEQPSRSVRATLGDAGLWPLWLVAIAFSVAIESHFLFLPTFVDSAGVGSVGLFYAWYAGTAIMLRLVLGWVPDRLGLDRTLVAALGAVSVSLFLVGWASTTSALLAAAVLGGIGHGFTFPILYSLVVTRAETAERGTALSIYTALFDLGPVIGGPLLGGTIRLFGYTSMFRLAGGVAMLGLLAHVRLRRARVAADVLRTS